MLHAFLCRFFDVYADFLQKYHKIFLIVPILITALLSIGFSQIPYRQAPRVDKLFVPEGGQYSKELEKIRTVWKLEPDRFHFEELFLTEHFVELLAVTNDNFFTKDLVRELSALSAKLESLSVDTDGITVSFPDVCLKFRGQCYGQEHLKQLNGSAGRLSDLGPVSYPISTMNNIPNYIAHVFGNVSLRSSNINEATAIRLQYFFRDDTPLLQTIGRKLMAEMVTCANSYQSDNFTIYAAHSLSLNQDLERNGRRLTSKFTGLVVIMICFVVLSSFSWMSFDGYLLVDWLHSQPTMALSGLLTAGMGVASGCGFVLCTGVTKFDTIVLIAPFLILCEFVCYPLSFEMCFFSLPVAALYLPIIIFWKAVWF